MKHIPLVLALFVAFVFLQSLVFKVMGIMGNPADIGVIIFSTIGTWIESIGLVGIGKAFASYGSIVVGFGELIASILILIPRTRFCGALLGLGIISGAIFFHVFTPLGIFPYNDLSCLKPGCPTEKPLFFMAVLVFLACIYLVMKLRSNSSEPN